MATPSEPFGDRGPIENPRNFYGRSDLISRAVDYISKRKTYVSIVGAPRLGKSSVLHYVAYMLSEQDTRTLCVYIDCRGWRHKTVEQLYSLWLEELNKQLQEWNKNIQELNKQSGETRSTIPPIETTAIHGFNDFEEALRAVVRNDVRLVFLLDSFHKLAENEQADAPFFSGLRGLTSPLGITYLTATTKPLALLDWADPNVLTSDFPHHFATFFLPLFTRAEAEALLTGLWQQTGTPVKENWLAFLLELAGPHPLLLQIAGWHAWRVLAPAASDSDSARSEAERLKRVRADFVREATNIWTQAWKALPPGDQVMLARLMQCPDAAESPDATESGTVDQFRGRYREMGFMWDDEAGVPRPLSQEFRRFAGQQQGARLVQAIPIVIDRETGRVWLKGRHMKLTIHERRMLEYLVHSAGNPVSYRKIIAYTWQDEPEARNVTNLKSTLANLRDKLEEAGDHLARLKRIEAVGVEMLQFWPDPS